eukprot:COSAG06_NODE_70586_length_191_cov_26.673913_1_plen_20_part_10
MREPGPFFLPLPFLNTRYLP